MARFSPAIERLVAKPDAERALGAFRLIRPLGKGGFAPVWLAKEVYGEAELRTVAVKLFAIDDANAARAGGSTGSTGSSRQHDRIVDEARALCQVEHPNIVRFYALTEDAAAGVIGLVMELVRGTPLDARIRDLADHDARVPLDEVLGVGVAIASALAAVHQVGLVHRDIKPANVVEAGGVFKLIDFGIAAAEQRAERAVAPPTIVDDLMLVSTPPADSNGAFVSLTGTVGYIDPHCIETMTPATPASDLYALGATLFECVAGQVPAAVSARRAGAVGLDADVLEGRARPPSLAEVARDLPAALVALVDRLLDPVPAHRHRSAEAVAWELERIRREIAGHSRALPAEDIGPFRGLGRFEREDRDVYFGRTVEIAASVEMLRSRGLLALVGPSGSGKSSLARAGVLPAIVDGGLGRWPRAWDAVVTTPGVDARAALVAALAPFVDDAATRPPEAIVAALGERAQATGRGTVLLIDQLEELVTVASKEGRDFVVQLCAQLGAQAIPGVRAIVAARRDLLDPLLALGGLGRALTRGTLLVTAMSDATWGEVVDQALAAYGYALEDDALRTELLAQLEATATAMPLVQFALTQIWERRDRARKVIPRAALDVVGGIAGALEMHAEATVERYIQQNPEAEEATRRLLLAMTTPQGTRRARPRAALVAVHALAAAMLERLELKRLVVQDQDGLTVAHEVLLTKWNRLARWIDVAREERLLAEAIERDAREWATRKEAEQLWKGRRLAAAAELARTPTSDLGDDARAFVRAARQAERRGRVIFGAAAVSILAALATAAVYSTGQARKAGAALAESEQRRQQADDEHRAAQRALARSLEEQGHAALLAGDHARALVLLSGAYERDERSPTLRFLLADAQRVSDTLVASLEHGGVVENAAFSPAGARVVTASADRTAKVWDASDGKLLLTIDAGAPLTSAEFTPDGDGVLTAARYEAKVWDAYDGKRLASLEEARTIESLTFGAGGRYAIVRTSGGEIRLWEWKASSTSFALHGATRIALRDDGARAVVAGDATAAVVWDLVARKPLKTLREATETRKLAFLSDGSIEAGDAAGVTRRFDGETGRLTNTDTPLAPPKTEGATPASALDPLRYGHRDRLTSRVEGASGRYVTTSRDGTARIWRASVGTRGLFEVDAGAGARFARFSPCGRYVVNETHLVDAKHGTVILKFSSWQSSVPPAFSADGERVLTRDQGNAILLDTATGATLAKLATDGRAIALSRDGSRAATLGAEKTVKIWDTANASLVTTLGPLPDTPGALHFVTGASALIVGYGRSAARWDLASGKAVAQFTPRAGVITASELSADGRHLLTASTDGVARIWDAASGALVRSLAGHSEYLTGAAFSADGRAVVTASADRTAKVWNAVTGDLVALLTGHQDAVLDATFSADGARVATASLDGQVKIWDAANGRLLATVGDARRRDVVGSARFSPDGARLVATGTRAGLSVFDVHLEASSPAEVAALVARSKLPWRLDDGVLKPSTP